VGQVSSGTATTITKKATIKKKEKQTNKFVVRLPFKWAIKRK